MKGKKALQLAAAYIQQDESTAVTVLFIKKWRIFASKKVWKRRNKQNSQTSLNCVKICSNSQAGHL